MNYKTHDKIKAAIMRLAGQPPYLLNRDGDELNEYVYRHGVRVFDKRSWRTFVFICPNCLRISRTVAWRRRNAEYCDDRSNWSFECQECHDEDTENLQADWDDYYASRW